MGCYGIGVSRLISAVIEQNNDEKGIIWPREVAPYEAAVLSLDAADAAIMDISRRIHDELESAGISTLCDNRNERAGVKFNDAELIGIPLSIVVGQKSLGQNKVEVKTRRTGEVMLVDRHNLLEEIKRRVAES